MHPFMDSIQSAFTINIYIWHSLSNVSWYLFYHQFIYYYGLFNIPDLLVNITIWTNKYPLQLYQSQPFLRLVLILAFSQNFRFYLSNFRVSLYTWSLTSLGFYPFPDFKLKNIYIYINYYKKNKKKILEEISTANLKNTTANLKKAVIIICYCSGV